MEFHRYLSILALAALTLAASAIDIAAYSPASIIRRDVCIIGGGSSGTYSAIRLRDSGKTVAVVESSNRMGGHTNTYTDPVTNGTVDIGVIIFQNFTVVKDYFARFEIHLISTTALAKNIHEVLSYVDYRTGKTVLEAGSGDPSAALAAYAAQLAKYPYLEAGYDLPHPVPMDLLLPFGEIVKKYALQDAVQSIFILAQGIGDLLAIPTLYVFKLVGLPVLQALKTGFLTTAHRDNSQLYRSAQAVLGQDVLLSSRVLATDRNGKLVKVLVQTPQGKKLIVAKKLIVTIPPMLDNLVGFDLCASERELFKQFKNSAYYTGVLRSTGIPDNSRIINVGANSIYHLPKLPAIYNIYPARVPGLLEVKFGSTYDIPEYEVKGQIFASVSKLGAAGFSNGTSAAELVAYAGHVPFELTVPAKVIAAGFYKKLYRLQGLRNTYYNGATFHAHDSSLLWQFTEGLLPEILKSL